VGVGAHQRVEAGDVLPRVCKRVGRDDLAEPLDVELVADALSGGDDPDVVEGVRRPLEEREALAVAPGLDGEVPLAASGVPATSAMTEWSTTRVQGTLGLTLEASPPLLTMASRMEAKSTNTGTPVKSWNRTRDGM
jgi:hypothetical protein